MKEFLEAVEQNPELKEKVEALDAAGSAPAQYIALAAEYGFALTAADFAPAAAGGPVSDDELDAVAGGSGTMCIMNSPASQVAPPSFVPTPPMSDEEATKYWASITNSKAIITCPQCHRGISLKIVGGAAVCPYCGCGSGFIIRMV